MMDLRYIAGLFDGEGFITMRIQRYRDTRWPDNRKIQRRMVLNAGINMTDPRSIRQIAAEHNGYFKPYRKPAKPTHRPLHCWIVCNEKAAAFLEKIVPYLIIKKEEAVLALAYQNYMRERRGKNARGKAVSEEEWTYRETIIAEMRRLKHVSYPVEPQ